VSERANRPPLEWGMATRSRLGEMAVGDLSLVTYVSNGALVTVIDGLGHGSEAERAARIAAAVVRSDQGSDLRSLVRECHQALRNTRGAAISVAFISASEAKMAWSGIGNVEGRLLSGGASPAGTKGSLRLQSGVAGHELPVLATSTLAIRRGDLLILATDGIETAFGDSLKVTGSPQDIAQRILDQHGRITDDALVLVVRYLGGNT
jgi:negative regulator of sigma-B (phosphoserine phosphatase)